MSFSSSIPTQLAEVVQTAHINRAPSPRHDLNPSTAASTRAPAYIPSPPSSTTRRRRHPYDDLDELDDEEVEDVGDVEDDEDIPVSVLVRPREAPRRHRGQSFPPMPDLRFEQSYLHSIAGAETWWKVAWITIRDQVCFFPLQTITVPSFAGKKGSTRV